MLLVNAICFIGHREVVDVERGDVREHSTPLDEESQKLYKCKLLMECSVCPGCEARREAGTQQRCAK